MRVGFVTCVELGLSCIEEIYRVGGHLDLVVSLRDDMAPQKAGRVCVDELCDQHGIHLIKIGNINEQEAVTAIRDDDIDWLFIIGWSQIAQQSVLTAPNRGVLGMHPTLLPVGRGRAAIPWAILKGLPETGVTLFQLDDGVDTGPIIAQEVIPIRDRETAQSLYEGVKTAHRRLIGRVWPDLIEDRINPAPQDESLATVWPGRKPEDGRIGLTMKVDEVDRLVRAVTRPYPGAFIDIDGRRLRILAGKPLNANIVPDDALRLSLPDGDYYVTDYEWESIAE